MSRTIKTLLFSTLYPSSARPVHGIFVETRLRELLKTNQVQTKVVAPVPWFPFKAKCFREYAQFAATPAFEIREGVEIHHPRYILPPKIGMNMAPFAMAKAALPAIKKLIEEGFDFDLIDAHYYYPDGVAAGIVAKALGKPFIVTARGTDLNLISDYDRPKKLILDTAARAVASIGVCKALMDRLAELGADPAKLHVLRNGVDLERFRPVGRDEARKRLGLPFEKKIMLSVGHLVERKGHYIAVEALKGLPDILLVIVGSGPEERKLRTLAARFGVQDRVRLVGQIPNAELKWWYNAANVLTLCSSREGWANVLLEAMACGTPVVATNIWGTPEVVAKHEAGILMNERNAQSLRDSVIALFGNYPEREKTRAYAEEFSWESTSIGQLDIFKSCLNMKID